jgi:hypothetical protein
MSGRALVIRTSRSVSSTRVRRISSLIYSTRIVSSISFGRANRGLLAEALSDGGGGRTACGRNEVEELLLPSPAPHAGEAEALAAIGRRPALVGRRKDAIGVVDGGSECWPLIASCMPEPGSVVAPAPRAAVAAIHRIERLAAEPLTTPLKRRTDPDIPERISELLALCGTARI